MARKIIPVDVEAFIRKNRSALYGTMLGDATIRNPSGENTLMEFAHCGAQKDYLFHKYELFKPVSYEPTFVPYGKKKQYTSWRFRTSKNKAWNEVWKVFHSGGVSRKRSGREYVPKIVTTEILNSIGHDGVALWWMDDGFVSFQFNNETGWWNEYGRLSTCDYSFEENELMVDWFKRRYGATATIQRIRSMSNKSLLYPVLNFSWQQFLKIKKHIDPFIIPSMKHKTNIRALQFWMSKRLLEPHKLRFDGQEIVKK